MLYRVRWRRGIRRCIQITVTACSSCVENILSHTWPVQESYSSGEHGRHTAVDTMEVLNYLRSESYGDDKAIVQENNVSYHK